MDPLEDVLSLLQVSSYLSCGMSAGGRWAVAFPPPTGLKFNAVRRGDCWLRVDGRPDPVRLREGDCFVLTRPHPFTLASDLDLPAEPAHPLFAAAGDGVARAGEGDEAFLIGGGFDFVGRARELLLDDLPPVLHVSASTPEAATVRWAVGEIDVELRRRPMGGTLVAEHLALVMLIRILRLHLERDPGRTAGWLAGLADPTVVAALRGMHARPAHPWTVAELARVAAVSRSTLAARFKDVVGRGPLEYLTQWRVELAAERIRRGETFATVARSVGYGSESAFSVAFKRTMGCSPRAYRSRLTHQG